MFRLPDGHIPWAVLLLAASLLAAALPDSFLHRSVFRTYSLPFLFTRDIRVVHLLVLGLFLGWTAFTARLQQLRRKVAATVGECESAWGRLSPLVRDRAGAADRLAPLLSNLVPAEGGLLAAWELALEAERSARTPAQMISAANLLTSALALLPDVRQLLETDQRAKRLLAELDGLGARIEELRAPYNRAAIRCNRLLQTVPAWLGRQGQWPLLQGLPLMPLANASQARAA